MKTTGYKTIPIVWYWDICMYIYTQKHIYTCVYICMYMFSYTYEKPGRLYREIVNVVVSNVLKFWNDTFYKYRIICIIYNQIQIIIMMMMIKGTVLYLQSRLRNRTLTNTFETLLLISLKLPYNPPQLGLPVPEVTIF